MVGEFLFHRKDIVFVKCWFSYGKVGKCVLREKAALYSINPIWYHEWYGFTSRAVDTNYKKYDKINAGYEPCSRVQMNGYCGVHGISDRWEW